MKYKYYLYCHTNKINGKKYIGISLQSPNRRWRNEGKGYKGCHKFERAIEKYGWDNFEHEILVDNLSQQEASHLEREYIEKYDTINNGYNILQGGLDKSENGGEIYFNKQPLNQYSLDKQLIRTWDSAMEVERELGFNHSGIGLSCRRKHKTAYGYIWRYSNDCDDIDNLTLTHINCCHNREISQTRKVNQYDLQGNFIKQWNCIMDIAKIFDKPTTLFTNCCMRKSKIKTAYGYQWRYADDCNDIGVLKYYNDKLIYEIDNDNHIIHTFNGITEIKNFYNDDKMRLSEVLNGRQTSTRGRRFIYAENYKGEN